MINLDFMDPLGTMLLLVLTVSGVKTQSGIMQENEFRIVSSSGCELVVECTITGGAATVWQGTIFDDCQNDKITLRHSQFTSGIEIQESCGAWGPIIGRGISVADGSFTSQLLVNISEDLFGRTIECANKSGQIIGSKQINTPSALLTSININPTEFVLQKPMTNELTITWDIEYDGILYSSDTLNMTQQLLYYYNNYTVNTSNCGICPPTTSSTSVTCNLTVSDLVAGMCNVTVIARVIECDITTNATSEQHSVRLINNPPTTPVPDSITEQNLIPKRKGWSRNIVAISLPVASTGILLLVLAIVFMVAIMKYKSKHKTQTILNLETEANAPSDHLANDPTGSNINIIMVNLIVHRWIVETSNDRLLRAINLPFLKHDLGQYSLLQHPSNEEGLMTYLEIGSDTRVRTNIIPNADRVEYSEVNHTQHIDKYLNLDTLLIQVRCQVTSLWHEFGVAAGVPMDILNKYLNYTPEESIVEVLDYWLRQGGKTWKDVAHVLNEIHLQELAEKVLKVYNTGLLPTTVVDEDIMVPAITSGI